ncbi:hypothetical protein [Paenibacillus crassostreae]|uniref:hypothetical protein n=1 Tax=Paenibacillus crassostreae TaxID=1763538 RepID=UPI0012FE5F38|nr:hypothetical protein [Paenibacillus crassostreae]
MNNQNDLERMSTLYKQRYNQKTKNGNTVPILMIQTFGDYLEGKEYTVDLLLADMLVTHEHCAVLI